MATSKIETQRARVQALGYRLYVTADGTQLVVDHNAPQNRTEVVFIHVNDADDDLEEWLVDQEEHGAPREAQESRAVKVWRNELRDDITRLSAAIDGLGARVTALDHNKAPIDDATRLEIQV